MPSVALSVALKLNESHVDGLSIDVEFEVPPGVTVLFGPSGAGKSRTLACIAGILTPEEGRIVLGKEVWFDGDKNLPIHERRVAYMFQSLALFPHMTALENVLYGIPKGANTDDESRRKRAVDMLERMHVPRLADRRPRTFSGGEAQRVALARAFAMEPQVMLLDEPFSALDATVKNELLREVGEQLSEKKIPTVLVTHQPEDAETLGERVVFVEKGRVTRTTPMSDSPFR